MGLFDSIKNTAKSAVNSVSGNQTQNSQTFANQQQTQQSTTALEVPSTDQQNEVVTESQPVTTSQNGFIGKRFYISGNPLVKPVVFFEDHIQYGDDSIPYSDLSEITITHMAGSLTNGVASALHKTTNKKLTFAFRDPVNFPKAVDYANEKIAESNGNADSRKHILRSSDGAKLEVFEDYISIKRIGGGLSGVMGQGNTNEIIMIPNISGISTSNGTRLIINYTDDSGVPKQSVLAYNEADAFKAEEIISYVQGYTPESLDDELENELWKEVKGCSREFPLLGKVLIVNEERDSFNSYMKMYMNCAVNYSQIFKKKYISKVHDCDSFLLFHLPIYKEYLEKIVKRTSDILVSAGIWTETEESIMARHIDKYHLALDDYNAIYESLQLTVQNNKQQMSALTGMVPNLVGGGFGLKGAVKGIAKATAFNLVRDGVESALVGAMNVSPTQKNQLYGRIKQESLFDRVFLDYWKVFLTLIDIMNENGKNIWNPSTEDSAKADNIMKNVSNPNFPVEQFPEVMISVLGMNPYKRAIYELLRNKGADENEVNAISSYFGYTDNTPKVVG